MKFVSKCIIVSNQVLGPDMKQWRNNVDPKTRFNSLALYCKEIKQVVNAGSTVMFICDLSSIYNLCFLFLFLPFFFLGDIQLPSSVVEAMQMQVNVEYLNLFFVA